MDHYICITCGVQYEGSADTPERCAICSEERQYINPNGQSWTTLKKMRQDACYKTEINLEEKGLYSLHTKPDFAIGQTAYLVQHQGFHVLWDCLTYLDEATIKQIRELGGIHGIALSHPHFYSSQVEWAETFDAPIYIHEDDKEWVMRPSDRIVFWSGDSYEIQEGLTLYRLGGHYKGAAVLHWEYGHDQKGTLLTGDTIQVVADQQWVSFMYSYPNLIPLPASKVQEIANTVSLLKFERIYNGFKLCVKENANRSVQNSARRYIQALNGTLFDT